MLAVGCATAYFWKYFLKIGLIRFTKLSTSDIFLSTYADLITSGENSFWIEIYITEYSCSRVSMSNCQMEIRVQVFIEASPVTPYNKLFLVFL